MSDGRDPTQYHTFHEILSQPETWQATLAEAEGLAASAVGQIGISERPRVLFTGCGSPFFLARTAAASYRLRAGAPAEAVPASDLMLFPELALAGTPQLLIAVSRSGATTEVLRAVELFKARTGRPTLAITCYSGTELAQRVGFTLTARRAEEQSLAQTRSFTAMLILAQCVINALSGRPVGLDHLGLPKTAAMLLETHGALARRFGEDRTIERFFFLGGGPLYGLACEAMLKMKEMSLSYAEAYHPLEFRHGPMAVVNDRTLVVGLLSSAGLAHEAAVLGEMRALGARTLALTPQRLRADQADDQIVLPDGLDDSERGPLYLPLLQLITLYRALHNGLNPDLPTNLNAVVRLDTAAIEAAQPTEAGA